MDKEKVNEMFMEAYDKSMVTMQIVRLTGWNPNFIGEWYSEFDNPWTNDPYIGAFDVDDRQVIPENYRNPLGLYKDQEINQPIDVLSWRTNDGTRWFLAVVFIPTPVKGMPQGDVMPLFILGGGDPLATYPDTYFFNTELTRAS